MLRRAQSYIGQIKSSRSERFAKPPSTPNAKRCEWLASAKSRIIGYRGVSGVVPRPLQRFSTCRLAISVRPSILSTTLRSTLCRCILQTVIMATSAPPTGTGSSKIDAAKAAIGAKIDPTAPTGIDLYSRFAFAGAVCCSITHGALTPVDVYVSTISAAPLDAICLFAAHQERRNKCPT
jgi:hypothetical protein